MLEAHECTFRTLVMESSLFVDNASLWLQLDHLAEHLGSRSFVHGDANSTEAVLFTMFSLSCCMSRGVYQHLAYSARGESVHILDQLHWFVMET